MGRLADLFRKLLHVHDTPERTALAFSLGVFLGFSPFVGFHTLGAIGLALVFNLSRVAVLLGAWSNLPWWVVPYYAFATWLGTKVIGFRIDQETLSAIFRLGREQGFLTSVFWNQLASQWPLLASFLIGSLILSLVLALITYPLSLKWIRFYRSKKDASTLLDGSPTPGDV
jgi:uncharacterized protein